MPLFTTIFCTFVWFVFLFLFLFGKYGISVWFERIVRPLRLKIRWVKAPVYSFTQTSVVEGEQHRTNLLIKWYYMSHWKLLVLPTSSHEDASSLSFLFVRDLLCWLFMKSWILNKQRFEKEHKKCQYKCQQIFRKKNYHMWMRSKHMRISCEHFLLEQDKTVHIFSVLAFHKATNGQLFYRKMVKFFSEKAVFSLTEIQVWVWRIYEHFFTHINEGFFSLTEIHSKGRAEVINIVLFIY